MDGANYLVPVDARLESDTDVEYETVQLDRVLRATEGAALRMVILDACRDNPLSRGMRRVRATRSISRGSFGDLDEQQLLDETLVAYAAAAGTTAADGSGRNSPYTEALLTYLERPLEISAPVSTGARARAGIDRGSATAARVPVAAGRPLPERSRGRARRHGPVLRGRRGRGRGRRPRESPNAGLKYRVLRRGRGRRGRRGRSGHRLPVRRPHPPRVRAEHRRVPVRDPGGDERPVVDALPAPSDAGAAATTSSRFDRGRDSAGRMGSGSMTTPAPSASWSI